VPTGQPIPRQWKQDDAYVLVREVPCTGKMDGQYLISALEGGASGLCVAACPKGECQLAQGNYRAEVRIGTIRKLLAEIGMEPERAELVNCPPGESSDRFQRRLREAVGRVCGLGQSPIRG
jgi:F420-non-reducing hydrogenase iron-sulfur subunit